MIDMNLYANKSILAPMVRIGSLPMRLLAAEYGADLVYSPEFVDKKIISCERVENYALGSIDFVDPDKKVVFRTIPAEKSRLIFQLGTADPDLALLAAAKVAKDVAGIDVNCGCPKHFSIHAGMGAALLSRPDKLLKILENLTANLPIPVSCKIRLLDSPTDTIELCKAIEKTGISALAVHMRTIHERPKDPAHWSALRSIVESINIPVIANGDIYLPVDMIKLRELTGCSSFMIARAAQLNPSVFRSEGVLSQDEVTRAYVQKSIDTDNVYQNTKYVLVQMLQPISISKAGPSLLKARSMQDICAIWNLEDNYNDMQNNLQQRTDMLNDHRHAEKAAMLNYDDELPYIPGEVCFATKREFA